MANQPLQVIEKVEQHFHNHVDTAEILSLLNIIKHQNHKIMALVDDLKTQVADLKLQVQSLQESVDLEQAQIAELFATNAAVVQSLNEQIAILQTNQVTPEQAEELKTSLTEVKDSIALTKADLEATV